MASLLMAHRTRVSPSCPQNATTPRSKSYLSSRSGNLRSCCSRDHRTRFATNAENGLMSMSMLALSSAFRYTPTDCKDQETNYPRWIVEAWERLLDDHFRHLKDPENALVTGELWFGVFPAVMRIRVTTPNVLAALRKHDPGAAKPYNFALSPILLQSTP